MGDARRRRQREVIGAEATQRRRAAEQIAAAEVVAGIGVDADHADFRVLLIERNRTGIGRGNTGVGDCQIAGKSGARRQQRGGQTDRGLLEIRRHRVVAEIAIAVADPARGLHGERKVGAGSGKQRAILVGACAHWCRGAEHRQAGGARNKQIGAFEDQPRFATGTDMPRVQVQLPGIGIVHGERGFGIGVEVQADRRARRRGGDRRGVHRRRPGATGRAHVVGPEIDRARAGECRRAGLGGVVGAHRADHHIGRGFAGGLRGHIEHETAVAKVDLAGFAGAGKATRDVGRQRRARCRIEGDDAGHHLAQLHQRAAVVEHHRIGAVHPARSSQQIDRDRLVHQHAAIGIGTGLHRDLGGRAGQANAGMQQADMIDGDPTRTAEQLARWHRHPRCVARRLPVQARYRVATALEHFHAHCVALTGLERDGRRTVPGRRMQGPVVDHQIAVHPQPHAVVGLGPEGVVAGARRLDEALPTHRKRIRADARRRAGVAPIEIDLRILAHHRRRPARERVAIAGHVEVPEAGHQAIADTGREREKRRIGIDRHTVAGFDILNAHGIGIAGDQCLVEGQGDRLPIGFQHGVDDVDAIGRGTGDIVVLLAFDTVLAVATLHRPAETDAQRFQIGTRLHHRQHGRHDLRKQVLLRNRIAWAAGRDVGGFAPVQPRHRPAAALEHLHAHHVALAGDQIDRRAIVPGRPMQGPVVDHQRAVDPQPNAIVRLRGEYVSPGLRRLDHAVPAHREIVAADAGCRIAAAPVEIHGRIDTGTVRCAAGKQIAVGDDIEIPVAAVEPIAGLCPGRQRKRQHQRTHHRNDRPDNTARNGTFSTVIPAKAGIQRLSFLPNFLKSLDSRFRGNDGSREFWLSHGHAPHGLLLRRTLRLR